MKVQVKTTLESGNKDEVKELEVRRWSLVGDPSQDRARQCWVARNEDEVEEVEVRRWSKFSKGPKNQYRVEKLGCLKHKVKA